MRKLQVFVIALSISLLFPLMCFALFKKVDDYSRSLQISGALLGGMFLLILLISFAFKDLMKYKYREF